VRTADPPPWWRALLAFAIAPAIAALAFSCASPLYAGLTDVVERIWRTFQVVVVVGGYFPTLIFGVPIFVFLRRRLNPTLLNCTLIGAGIAGLPWLLLALLPFADSASIDGRATIVDHHLTWFGLWMGTKVAALIGLFGALAGAAFWLIAASGLRKARNARTGCDRRV